jgi:hypothetical protein
MSVLKTASLSACSILMLLSFVHLTSVAMIRSDVDLGFDRTLVACTMFRDDAMYIGEWLAYHHAIGVEHFWLYSDRSVDDYKRVIAPFQAAGIATLIEWPPKQYHGRHQEDFRACLDSIGPHPLAENAQCSCQHFAFLDCIDRAQETRSEWVAVFDVDEFMYTPNRECQRGALSQILREQPSGVAAMMVSGWLSGTQGYERPEHIKSGFVTKDYLYRNPVDGKVASDPRRMYNDALKSIGRTSHVASSTVHTFMRKLESIFGAYRYDWHRVDDASSPVRMMHYQFKSYESLKRKIKRNKVQFQAYRPDRDYWNSMKFDDEVLNCSLSMGVFEDPKLILLPTITSQSDPPLPFSNICIAIMHSDSSDNMVKIRKSFWSAHREIAPLGGRVIFVDLVGSDEAREHLIQHAPPGSYTRNQTDAEACKIQVPRASWEWVHGVNSSTWFIE